MAQESLRSGGGKILGVRWELEVCCEITFPRHVRSYICDVSPTCLPKYDLNKDNMHGHANIEGRKLKKPLPYTKSYW